MAEGKSAKTSTSSPVATVQQIQRRFVRPSSSAFTPPPTSTVSSLGDVRIRPKASQFKLRTAKKLDDYLDSDLLSQIAAKLSRAKNVWEKKEEKDFDWPIDELKVLVDSEKEVAVNLKDDSDLIEEIVAGNGESCTPFRRFEEIAVRRFRG